MLQTFDFVSSPAAPVRQIDAKGNFFRYESGSALGADEGVQVRVDGNDLGIWYPGDGIELEAPGKRWEIVPLVVGCAGRVRIGMGRVTSARLVGVVQVVDTRVSRSRSGQAFSYRYSSTGAAGQYPTTTIQNPAASGKRIVINALSLGSSIAGGVSYGFSTTGPVVGASILTPRNKLSGGPATVSVVNSSSSATLYGGTGMSAMDSAFLQASATQQVQLQEPIVVLPGATFVIGGETVAQQIAGRLEFYEDANV